MLFQKSSISALLAWSLYDWANSAFPTVITTFVFATYFTQKIAINPISGTAEWGRATSLACLLIAILSPPLGAISDYTGYRKRWIGVFTAVTVLCSALLWFAQPSPAYINWTLTCVVVGTFCYGVSLVFYNAMMNDLVENNYLGRLSGWSWGIGYAGGLVCLCISLLFVQSLMPYFHLNNAMAEQVRISGPLVAIWYAFFSIPFFLFTPDAKKPPISFKKAIFLGLMTLYNTFKNCRRYKRVFVFLLAQMIYMDGLNTLFIFGGIYAAGTFHFTPGNIILFGIGMNITAAFGAICFAWIDDYIGSKHTVLIGLFFLILFGTILLFIQSIFWFWIYALALGLFIGPVQAASRSLLVHIAPPEQLTELFGLYALSGKVTAFIGPWVLGTVTAAFASQRVGMATVMVFLTVGALLLSAVS